MEVTIAAGAKFEVLTQQELKHELDNFRRALDAATPKPLLKRFQAAVTLDSNGEATVTIDGPPTGFTWDIRRIAISGPTEAVVAGSCFLYRNVVSPLNLLDFTSAIPDVGPWTARQISLFGTEELIAHITNGVAGARIFFNGQAWQFIRQEHDVIPPRTD
jgi:hypothetical protein